MLNNFVVVVSLNESLILLRNIRKQKTKLQQDSSILWISLITINSYVVFLLYLFIFLLFKIKSLLLSICGRLISPNISFSTLKNYTSIMIIFFYYYLNMEMFSCVSERLKIKIWEWVFLSNRFQYHWNFSTSI